MSSDEMFVMVTPGAVDLIHAVHAGDEAKVRDLMLDWNERGLWALVLALAAMAPARPDPEDVLAHCCSVETRLTHSDSPDRWPMQDLQDALCVARARTDAGARWVERGVTEWRRRHEDRQAHLATVNDAALAARAAKRAS